MQKTIKEIENSDIIVAPIADNKMFQVLGAFADGEITTTQAYHSLSSSTLGKQYVLKTQKAIDQLKQFERLYLCKEEKKELFENGGSEGPRGPIVNTSTVGRNDPCPCGSGKKYKNCCGR